MTTTPHKAGRSPGHHMPGLDGTMPGWGAGKLRIVTPVKTDLPERRLGFGDVIVGVGSCFSQYLMEYLAQRGVAAVWNPGGIVYNAVSIEDSILRVVDERLFTENDFFNAGDLWRNWELHGSLSSPDLGEALTRANDLLRQFREKLLAAKLFVLTPSSSVVYRLRNDGRVVANCHKMPGDTFERGVLSPERNRSALASVIEAVRKINPDCMIVISLSPVRHYPGDLVLNTLSKANLVSAIHDCVDCRRGVYYFPAYEILLDELRDYRFYNDDLLHPSELARRIILDRFLEAYCDAAACRRIDEAEAGLKAKGHRPLHAAGNAG